MANDVTVMLDGLFERKLTLDETVARFIGEGMVVPVEVREPFLRSQITPVP